MAILSKFLDNQALIIDGLVNTSAPDARPKTKDVANVLKALVRPDAVEGTTLSLTDGESKAHAAFRSLAAGTMLIGCLAISGAGIPLIDLGFSGYYSKDAIIAQPL